MLTLLDPRHADALEAMLTEFDPDPGELHGYFCPRNWPIDRIVDELDAQSRGERLPEDWVPSTTWFWEADDVLHGVLNVRHHLTPGLRQLGGHIGYCVAPSRRGRGVATAMLSAALRKCPHLGIGRALLTVNSDNLASQRVIERNGGVLEREGPGPDRVAQRWYWIDSGGTRVDRGATGCVAR